MGSRTAPETAGSISICARLSHSKMGSLCKFANQEPPIHCQSGRVLPPRVRRRSATPTGVLKESLCRRLRVRCLENKAGKQVFSDTFNVSALTYTEEEMKQVLDFVRNSNEDPALKAFAEQRLAPVKETGGVTSTSTAPKPERKPAPAPSTSNTPEAPKKGSGSSDSPLAIVIGVLLGLLGLGAAAYGWAVQQGVVKAPF